MDSFGSLGLLKHLAFQATMQILQKYSAQGLPPASNSGVDTRKYVL